MRNTNYFNFHHFDFHTSLIEDLFTYKLLHNQHTNLSISIINFINLFDPDCFNATCAEAVKQHLIKYQKDNKLNDEELTIVVQLATDSTEHPLYNDLFRSLQDELIFSDLIGDNFNQILPRALVNHDTIAKCHLTEPQPPTSTMPSLSHLLQITFQALITIENNGLEWAYKRQARIFFRSLVTNH